MGMPRPAMPARLKKGALIDSREGVVDTWNWTTDTVHNLKAKDGVKIFWADSSHPIITGTQLSVSFTGTDDSVTSADVPEYHFHSTPDSNVQISCVGNDIYIGAYYV